MICLFNFSYAYKNIFYFLIRKIKRKKVDFFFFSDKLILENNKRGVITPIKSLILLAQYRITKMKYYIALAQYTITKVKYYIVQAQWRITKVKCHIVRAQWRITKVKCYIV